MPESRPPVNGRMPGFQGEPEVDGPPVGTPATRATGRISVGPVATKRIGAALGNFPRKAWQTEAASRDRPLPPPAALNWAPLAFTDESGVATEGLTEPLDVRNSYIRADGRLVCAIGVEDLVVSTRSDAILVANEPQTQDVKRLIERLRAHKARGHAGTGAPALGLVPDRRPRRPLPGEAHPGPALGKQLSPRSSPSRRALGPGARYR